MPDRKTPHLLDRIFLRRISDGCYYSAGGDSTSNIVWSKVPSSRCELTVEYSSNQDQFYLRSHYGSRFQYHHQKSGHIVHISNKKYNPKLDILFTLIDIKDKKDTYVILSSRKTFIHPRVNEKGRLILGGYDGAHVQLVDAALKRTITDISFKMQSAKITQLTPQIALKTTLRNDSDAVLQQRLSFSYVVSHVGSWSDSRGSSLGATGEVPILVDGKVEKGVMVERSSKVETIADSTAVQIPPKMRGVATVRIYRAKIDVPFDYTETVWYRSGESSSRVKQGGYSNTETYGVATDLDWDE